MLYDLSSAPSFFQKIINDVLHDFHHKFIIACIDDILIYSTDYHSHVKHISLVLQRLLKHQLYIKGEKKKGEEENCFSWI